MVDLDAPAEHSHHTAERDRQLRQEGHNFGHFRVQGIL